LIKIPYNDLKLHEEIGSGAFGTVYRGTWLSTHYTVAVKKLQLNHSLKDVENAFLKELRLLHNLRGPHIVTFLGACMEEGKYALVMEYMSLGSLYKILHMDKLELEWTERLSIALQAATGVNYLHQLPEPILHRDIKSLNFLLEKTYEGYGVKVCDFGVARLRNETTRLTGVTSKTATTLPWTAPEVLNLQGHTEKSDIYSLGIVYWELATCKIPYADYADAVVYQCVLAGKRLQEPLENTPPNFRTIIEQCWAHNPCDRPNGTELIQMIGQCIPGNGNRLSFLFSFDHLCRYNWSKTIGLPRLTDDLPVDIFLLLTT
jgi:sterile alpha motif and leucine zipper-containing kinase AZK